MQFLLAICKNVSYVQLWLHWGASWTARFSTLMLTITLKHTSRVYQLAYAQWGQSGRMSGLSKTPTWRPFAAESNAVLWSRLGGRSVHRSHSGLLPLPPPLVERHAGKILEYPGNQWLHGGCVHSTAPMLSCITAATVRQVWILSLYHNYRT